MKPAYILAAVGIVGVFFGYGLTAGLTHAQLDRIAETAAELDLTPTSSPGGNIVPAAGGSCG